MNLWAWFSGADDVGHDARWAWVTVTLSALLGLGYCLIAFNWYFQSRLARSGEATKTLARLRNLCIICGLCGYLFYVLESRWAVWRMYDAVLLVLNIHTWWFVSRMRGMSLVDERLAQVDELEKSAARYREIAELLPHMVWTAGNDGKIDFGNQRWSEFVGDNRTWLDALHPDDRAQARRKWNEAVSSRRPCSLEVRLGGPEIYRTFQIRATPIVHGDAVKWLGACADIEDQKLLVAQKELQAKQRSFFLNALSHDLRAPLNNIVLNAHLLKLGARDESELESVATITENALAAADLVTKLLDFARAGAQEANRIETLSLISILRQLQRRFAPVAEQKSLYLRLLEQRDVTLMTDRQKLERILSNLIDNAIKYTQSGGVTIELLLQESQLIIRVSDTGIGIPPESAPHLFDEFYQVNNYERDRTKGFGMGLAICKSLAHHIGADVHLAGTGPGGSAFDLCLKGISPDRGGRRSGANGDLADPAEAGVCSF
jgi:PAS domain S-box-containing protein